MDWWAYGVLLYEMMAGQQPFEGEDDAAIYKNIKEKKAVFPKHFSQESMDVITSVSFLHLNVVLEYFCNVYTKQMSLMAFIGV